MASTLLVACSKGDGSQANSQKIVCSSVNQTHEVYIEGGHFPLGDIRFYPEETPVTSLEMDGFWIDRTEVTNRQFAEFIKATGYKTQMERGFSVEQFPDIPDEFRVPGSMVFIPPKVMEGASPLTWWQFIPGASWKHPSGPDSSISNKDDYPVVHITLDDAKAYASWAGRKVPTEAQWEFAAGGGEDRLEIETDKPPTNANTWQGIFPVVNKVEDGFSGIAPVGCFEPNAVGAVDMVGNVWELTDSQYYPKHGLSSADGLPDTGYDPNQPGIPVQVIKGGSFLCAQSYCARYRPQSRQPQDMFLASSHIGFRTIRDE